MVEKFEKMPIILQQTLKMTNVKIIYIELNI